jgi:hypothetical protein
MANNPVWLRLTDIFNGAVTSRSVRNAIKTAGELDDATEDLIDKNFENVKAIQDREFPEQIIPPTANIKEAIDIFYIVNASGVNLTDAELALAQISGYWPDARELFKKKLASLQSSGFDFKLDFIVYVLLAVLYDLGSDMKRLHGEENKKSIMSAWQKLDTSVLDYVINLLRTNAYVDHSDEINSPFGLIPIISFVFKKPQAKLNEVEIKRAIKWFYYAQLRQRYISQTPQKLDKDLSIVKDSSNAFDEMIANLQLERALEITKDEFVGRDIRHPIFSLMRWYFKSRNAVCLGTGVGLRRNMGAKYELENDHIFPYSALRDNGYPVENRFKYALAQELTNRAILTKVENRAKSATPAYDYLTTAKHNFPGALEKQCIPTDEVFWQLENYEKFLDARREILAKELNDFLKGITETKSVSSPLSPEDVIAEGEHGGLEFKSSLRWDMEEACVNRAIENAVLKSISAFNNAEGGKLLIGVRDDGTVLGLDSDYTSLEGDKDLFERHLRALINKRWGNDYGPQLVNLSFPKIGETEICIVDVKKGKKPLYFADADKNGQKSEKFFIRSGNASIPIDSLAQVASYVKEHFS